MKMLLRGCVATAAISCLLFLAACGDESSSVAPNDDEPSSSSVIPGIDPESSSSSAKSSSSKDELKSSSSGKDVASSSSRHSPLDGESSRSSIGEVVSSSSSVELNCSALLEGEAGWNWDVPKECRFNPAITYGTMIDSRDKKVYKTIKVGDQVWMAENLNYADSSKTPSLLKRSWCYNNVAANCDVVGRLYTWAAAIDSVKLATDADNPQDCGYGKTCTLPAKVQGICPDGWHLPDTTEWRTLINTVGGANVAGKKLKATIGWKAYCGIITNEDAYGFSALPAGGRSYDGNFDGDGYGVDFWSTTEGNSYGAYGMDLDYNGDNAFLYGYTGSYGFSVRCLQD